MSSKFTLGGRQPGQRIESSGSPAVGPQAHSTVSLKDVPREVVEDHIIPAAKALGDGTLVALGGTAKYMHARVMHATAVPLAVMLRKQIASSQVPVLPDDLAARGMVEGIRLADVSLGESLYALRRLEELFRLRGYHNVWPALGHGPSRPEAWCMELIETALQVLLDAPDGGNLAFPTGLSEAIHNLRESKMRPLLQWATGEGERFHFDSYTDNPNVEAVRLCAEKQSKLLHLDYLSEMPPIWLYATHIVELRIGVTEMRHFSPEIVRMDRLRSLYIVSGKELRASLFAEVPVGLKELCVQAADIQDIDETIFRLTNLERLELPRCNVTSLPESLRSMENLTKLVLKDISVNDAMCGVLHSLVGLKSLKLEYCREILRVGDRPLFPENLELLSLKGCNLTAVPQSVSRLSQLKELNLSSNAIGRIDKSLVDLRKLEKLNLSRNELTHFQVDDGSFKGLKHLDLSLNEFLEFPIDIFSCVELKSLNLEAVGIRTVPNRWGELAKLEDLTIGYGLILKLGASIAECSNLRSLRNGDVDMSPINPERIKDLIRKYRW